MNTLHLALGVSVVVHGVLLSVRFVDPEGFNRVFQNTPLEVILVNARTDERPEVATAIAQANMAGGGEAATGRATSPLPPAPVREVGDATESAQRRIEALQQQQVQMLVQLRQQLAALPPPDPRSDSNANQAQEAEDKRRQLVNLLAEIERRVNEENARPKKRYISPATREEAYAVYYDSLRRRIEDRGTENFPSQAGRKLYGELTMVVTINFDGQVLDTEVVVSSGNPVLDRRAAGIVRSAAPFGSFTPQMRRTADQIVVVSRFKFNRDESVQTQLTAQ